jgi:hypothetical protein
MRLILRRADVSRKSGTWQHEDYDVFDGDRDVGRIYLIDSDAGQELRPCGPARWGQGGVPGRIYFLGWNGEAQRRLSRRRRSPSPPAPASLLAARPEISGRWGFLYAPSASVCVSVGLPPGRPAGLDAFQPTMSNYVRHTSGNDAMHAETLDADYYCQRADFCYKLADNAHAARPLYARLYFLANAYEDKAKAADIQLAKDRAAAAKVA